MKLKTLKELRKGWQLYALFLLPLLYIIIFKYVPMYGAQIAFKEFNVTKGITGSPWVAFGQFERFFRSHEFWRLLKNTLSISFYTLLASFPFPIALALGLNYVRNRRFKNTVQMVTYAPYFISLVVLVGLLLQFLDPRTGMINTVLGWAGLGPYHFMAKASWFQSIYVWSNVWQNTGFSCIIYLAALSGIDPALHEAAVMDGATKVQRMRHIDLPGIMPIAVILLILNTGQMMETGFEKILLMQNSLNLRSSEVIDTYVYKVGLVSQAMNFSYATAIGLFKSVIGFILLLVVNQTAKKLKQESLW
ncbi:sugar ABC transporter permease [Paenibacillus sp. Y412MC10]|uniref:ABC transporter permease n=1 Tax=Geobacillus sp. (strain Y412MC10) TaxID=481743 RepID=UPI00164324D9|nr:ABC transporter permease subunit [Paenibacillus sp. Y412MC10]